MMIRMLSIISITLLFCCICLLHPSFNGTNKLINYTHYFLYGNKIDIVMNDDLDINKVKLVFKNEAQHALEKGFHFRVSSQSNQPICAVIFENGKQISDIPYSYGKQEIEVFYDNIKIGAMKHWQTLKFHSHTYQVEFFQKKQEVICVSNISGADVIK